MPNSQQPARRKSLSAISSELGTGGKAEGGGHCLSVSSSAPVERSRSVPVMRRAPPSPSLNTDLKAVTVGATSKNHEEKVRTRPLIYMGGGCRRHRRGGESVFHRTRLASGPAPWTTVKRPISPPFPSSSYCLSVHKEVLVL